jgi:hypothetical protein
MTVRRIDAPHKCGFAMPFDGGRVVEDRLS